MRCTCAALAAVLAVSLGGCAPPPTLGESVRTLITSRIPDERERAAERVAVSLNPDACADVAEAAGADPSLEPYLGQMRTELLSSLDSFTDIERRLAAMRSLSALGLGAEVEPVGWIATGDEDAAVRVAACEALAGDGSEEAVGALFEALAEETDDDAAAEKAALIAGLPEAMEITIAAYEESYEVAEKERIASVAAVAGEQWVDPLSNELGGDHNDAARAMLVRIGEPAVDKLISLLRSKKYAVRESAAETLVSIERGTPGSVERLMESLEDKDYKDIAKYYVFYIKLGREGSESTLRIALLRHGSKSMALDYLNCGNAKLESAAKTWASRHGYIVVPGIGSSGGPNWGEGL